MKILSLISLIIVLFTTICHSQTNWYNQNSGTNAILQDIYFTDENNGWISGVGPILHTSDGGQTWNAQNTPTLTGFYVDIFFTDPMNGWACGNEARIIHTTNGGTTWNIQSNPYTAAVPILYGVYFANPDTGWVVGGDHGTFPTYMNRRVILYTTNGGTSWDFQLDVSSLYPLYCVQFSSPVNGFAASEVGNVITTTNGGNTWVTKTPAGGRIYSIFFINPTTGWTCGEDVSVNHYSTISKTIDGGSSWSTQSFGPDEYLQDIYFIDELTGWAVGGTIGGSGGTQHSTILHTSDGGNSWLMQNSPTTSTLLGVTFPDPYNGWAAGIDGTVLKADNVVPVELISFSAWADNDNVVLNWRTATETNNKGFEILRSQKSKVKSQNQWEKIGFVEGRGTTTQENRYTYTDKNLASGEYSYKLMQIDLDGSRNESEVMNVEINSQPTAYKLKQNYPNPFNPTTVIPFSLTGDEHISLKVYNDLGEEVRTLVDGFEYAGKHKVTFDASGLSSGIYYYKMSTPENSIVKKMLLLK